MLCYIIVKGGIPIKDDGQISMLRVINNHSCIDYSKE